MNVLETGAAWLAQAEQVVSQVADASAQQMGADSPSQPIFRIEQLADSAEKSIDLTPRFRDRLMSLSLVDHRGFDADPLDLILNDSDGQLDLPKRGVRLRIWIGCARSGLVDKEIYTIDEVEHIGGPDVLTVRGRFADLRAGMLNQKERNWHRTTLGEIVQTIAKSYGNPPPKRNDLEVEFSC